MDYGNKAIKTENELERIHREYAERKSAVPGTRSDGASVYASLSRIADKDRDAETHVYDDYNFSDM